MFELRKPKIENGVISRMNGFDIFNSEFQEPLIISPNIGCPIILTPKQVSVESVQCYHFGMNIVSPNDLDESDVKILIQKNVSLVPLFDHDPQTGKLIRGNPIHVEIEEIKPTNFVILENYEIAKLYKLREYRGSYLLRHNFFGENKKLFYAIAAFQLSESQEILDRLKYRNFVMFDIVQDFTSLGINQQRVCYHSIVVRNEEWDTIKFMHVTDIHVAKRFDEILNIILNRKRQKYGELVMKYIEDRHGPLYMRYFNPNHHLRTFIQFANRESKNKNLDFVIMTGDIVDFCLKTTLPKMEKFKLEETNWDIFLRILLAEPYEIREFSSQNPYPLIKEEIAVPIYTVTGNHDVRLYGYPITALKYYEHFGLKSFEAELYNDRYSHSNLKALIQDKYCLQPYYQFINPFDDYIVRLGGSNFVFMNTGKEDRLNIKSLLLKNPQGIGFRDTQINFINSLEPILTENSMSETRKGFNFLLTHNPLLDPEFKNIIVRKITKIFKKKHDNLLENFKESKLKEKKKRDGRATDYLYFSIGTLGNNWIQALVLMLSNKMINLSGHTHMDKEMRFAFCEDGIECILPDGKYAKMPFAIYWDDYSQKYGEKFIEENLPVVSQTPSLGMGRYTKQNKEGAFTRIEISGNRLKTFKKEHLSDYISLRPNNEK